MLIYFCSITAKIEKDQLFGKEFYYLKQMPTSDNINGVSVLIPGYRHPYAVSVQTTILKEAEKNGIAVMMVNLTQNNENLPIDDESISKLGKMIKFFFEQEKIPQTTKLNMGGFSIDGTTALQFYTKKNDEGLVKKLSVNYRMLFPKEFI